MDRLSKPLRIAVVAGLALCLFAAWLGFRIYHQMTTPIGVIIVKVTQ